jgi:DNA-directed RNA polymerase specialized sigma24 family protein
MHDPYHLLPIAYRAASRVVRSPVLAEEAGERALHLLTLAMLEGFMPTHPEAWLRVVARRSACALLRSEWGRIRGIEPDQVQARPAPFQAPRNTGVDMVREHVQARLTPRQREALQAALTCNTTRAAARSCGMQPRDFRRYLGAISRKARRTLGDTPALDPHADDAAVQFGLPS